MRGDFRRPGLALEDGLAAVERPHEGPGVGELAEVLCGVARGLGRGAAGLGDEPGGDVGGGGVGEGGVAAGEEAVRRGVVLLEVALGEGGDGGVEDCAEAVAEQLVAEAGVGVEGALALGRALLELAGDGEGERQDGGDGGGNVAPEADGEHGGAAEVEEGEREEGPAEGVEQAEAEEREGGVRGEDVDAGEDPGDGVGGGVGDGVEAGEREGDGGGELVGRGRAEAGPGVAEAAGGPQNEHFKGIAVVTPFPITAVDMQSPEVQRAQEDGFGQPDLDCLLLKIVFDIELTTEILGKTTTLELANNWTTFFYNNFLDTLVTQLTRPPWIILVRRLSDDEKNDFQRQLESVTSGRTVVTAYVKPVSDCEKIRKRDQLPDHIVFKPRTVTLSTLLKALSRMSNVPEHLYINQFGQKRLVRDANEEFPWMEKLLQDPEAKFRVDAGFLLLTPNSQGVTLFSRGRSDTTVHDSRNQGPKIVTTQVYPLYNSTLGNFSCNVGNKDKVTKVKFYDHVVNAVAKSSIQTPVYMRDNRGKVPLANATLRQHYHAWIKLLNRIEIFSQQSGPANDVFRVEVSVNSDACKCAANGHSPPTDMQSIFDLAVTIGSSVLNSGRVLLFTANRGELITATRQTFKTLHAPPYGFGTGANNTRVSKRMLGCYFVLMNAVGFTLSKNQMECQNQILATSGEVQEEVGIPADLALEEIQTPSGARPLAQDAAGFVELENNVLKYCEMWNPHRGRGDFRCVHVDTTTAFKFHDPAGNLPSMADKSGLCKAIVLYFGTTWYKFLKLLIPRGLNNRVDHSKEAPTAQMVETEISEKVRTVIGYLEPQEVGGILCNFFECQSNLPLDVLWKLVPVAGGSPFVLPRSCTATSLEKSFPFPGSAVLSGPYQKWRNWYERMLPAEPTVGENPFWSMMALIHDQYTSVDFSGDYPDTMTIFNSTQQSCEVSCVTCGSNLTFIVKKQTNSGGCWLNTAIPTLPCPMSCGFPHANVYKKLPLSNGASGFYVSNFQNLIRYGVNTLNNSSGSPKNKDAHLFFVFPSLEIPILLQLRQSGWTFTCETEIYLLNTSEYFYTTFERLYCRVQERDIDFEKWPDMASFLATAKRTHVLNNFTVYFSNDKLEQPLGVWFESESGVRLYFDARCFPQGDNTVAEFLNNVMDLKYIVPTETVIDVDVFLRDPKYFMLYHGSQGLCPVKLVNGHDDAWLWNDPNEPQSTTPLKADFDLYFDEKQYCPDKIVNKLPVGPHEKTRLQDLLKSTRLDRTVLQKKTVEFTFANLSPNMVPIKGQVGHNCIGLTIRQTISPSSGKHPQTRAATAPILQKFLHNGRYTITTIGIHPRNNTVLPHIQEMDFISMSRSLLPQGSRLWIKITNSIYHTIVSQAHIAGHDVELPKVQICSDYLQGFYKLGGSSIDVPIESNQVSVICIIDEESPTLVEIRLKVLENSRCVLFFDLPPDAHHIFDFLQTCPTL